MRMPATVETRASAVGDFGVTLRSGVETCRNGVRPVPLPVAFVALATLDLRLGFFPTVGRKRLADVIGFLELPTVSAPDKSLVRARVHQFTPGGLLPPGRLLRCRLLG